MNWIYEVKLIPNNPDHLKATLNDMGADEWELVSCTWDMGGSVWVCIFKQEDYRGQNFSS